MSSLEIHQADTLHTTQDVVSHGSIACRYGVFIGDLLLVNDHSFKVFKLKQDHIPHSILMYDKDTAKTSDEAQTCEGWYRYALTKGYFQTLEEVFPKHFWNYDFDVYDFEYEILGLTERLDSLDLVNALDSEVTAAFVAQLQSGGDAFALVEAKVAAEALLRIAADNDVSSNLIDGASGSGNTLKLLEDRLATEEAKFSDSDVTNAIQLVQTDVDNNQQAADTDRALIRTQYLQADTDLIDGASSSGNTLKLLEDRVAAEVLARELAVQQLTDELIVYCDSNRADSYTEDGTKGRPYKSLVTALSSKITDTGTTTLVFKLAPGYYTGIYAFTKTTQNQSISILGSSAQDTFVQGVSAWTDDSIGNVLFFKNFNEVTVKNLTIQLGDYGFYPRSCKRVECDNVRFRWLGASSDAGNFDFSKTQAERQSMWSLKVTLSNGGACRIRACESVFVKNCEVYETLRGLRIQDCGGGVISNCRTDKTLESGIYLAAGSYTGTDGSSRFLVTGNQVLHALNNGLLCIGGKKNTFSGNCVIGCANAGFQSWSSVSCNVNANTFYNCNRLSYNGVGNNGDAQGTIVCDGNSNIQEGPYAISVLGNSMLKCNAGANAQVIGVNVSSGAFPTESNRCYVSDNIIDAALEVQSASIPLLNKKRIGNMTVSGTQVNFANLPTSPTGLSVGDLWNNTGICSIKL